MQVNLSILRATFLGCENKNENKNRRLTKAQSSSRVSLYLSGREKESSWKKLLI